MKNMFLIMTSFLALSFFPSCTESRDEVKKVLPSDSLSTFLSLPTSIEFRDNKLFVVDPFDKEGMVKVIDTKTKELSLQFAPKGEGANEMIHVGSMDIYRDANNSLIVNLFDPTSQRLYTFDYDSLNLKRNKYTPEIHSLSDNNVNFHELLKFDKGYIATGMNEKAKYMILSDSLKIVNQFGAYRNKPSEAVSDMLHTIANYGKSFISNDRNFLAEIIYNASVLSFYDLKTNKKLWEHSLGDLDYSLEDEQISYKSLVGYLSACITDKYIYALYSGEKDQEDEIATYGKMIHVFNYEGKLIKKYELSTPSFSISIDTENKKMYVLSHKPEPKILIYDLL